MQPFYTSKQLGGNGHMEYGWSHALDAKIVQFFFQLVRSDNHENIEKIHREILLTMLYEEKKYRQQFSTMYKLIGQTRDIISGKGEQKLAFMQILGFYKMGYEDLAVDAFIHFVIRGKSEHPYGSWKDVKYFAQYIKEKTNNTSHRLILIAIQIALSQQRLDMTKYKLLEISDSYEYAQISLVGKWIPREKSKRFGWIHEMMAKLAFPHFIKTAKNPESMRKAILKSKIHFTRELVTLNKYLETVQCKQSNGNWNDINFNKVTSATMRNQSRSFANKEKTGGIKNNSVDRIKCSENFREHLTAAKTDPENNKVHGERLNVYQLVKDAFDVNPMETEKIDTINLAWKSNRKNNKNVGNIIPCVDTSVTMYEDGCSSLYNAIGLGIRLSEVNSEAFRNRILTFNTVPKWFKFEEKTTFVEKVWQLRDAETGTNADFYTMLKMILDICIENNIHPELVKNMTLAIFSNMNVELSIPPNNGTPGITSVSYFNTLYENIEAMYKDAGMNSLYQTPFTTAHILFWNLKKTSGFPVLTKQKNVSMLSGYSSNLLNTLCEKGVHALKEDTPKLVLSRLLSNKRYDILNNDLRSFFG
jgi:hypothetical protein